MKTKRTTRTAILILTLGALALPSLIPATAEAVPAFARKYNFSCTTCHAPVPRLKDYGEEFAGNGFRLPEGEEPVRAYRDTGDAKLTLQRDLPIAVRFDAYVTYQTEEDDDFSDLKTPWGVKLLSGGSVAPKVGYYFYFYFSERGEVAGIEDAYLHFNDLKDKPFDVMVGQFQISDPMMKRELRLSFEDYEVYKVRVGDSATNLTYDRGVMITYDTPFGLGLVGEVVNGNGKDEAGEDRAFDQDRDKGYAGRAIYGVGPVTVGGFYYRTHENLVGAEIAKAEAMASNEVEIYGPDIGIALSEKAHFTGQYLHRVDSDPYTDPAIETRDVETDGVAAELVVLPEGPDGRMAFVGLFNWIDSDDDALDLRTVTASAQHVYRRNLRFALEYTFDLEHEESKVSAGFSSAF